MVSFRNYRSRAPRIVTRPLEDCHYINPVTGDGSRMAFVDNSEDQDPLLTESSPGVNTDYPVEDREDLRPENQKQPCFPHRFRLTFLCFLGYTIAFMMRASFNIALVSMVNFTATDTYNSSSDQCPAPIVYDNSTAADKPGEFNWPSHIQSMLLGAFFYGYAVSQFPGGLLAERFGPHIIFGLSVLLPGVFTVFTPFIAHWSPYVLGAARVLNGATMGPMYPAFYQLMSRWAPPFERIKLMAYAINGAQIGSVIAFGISGFLCDLDFLGGWPLVFYLFGGLGILWFFFWWIFASDTPASDSSISPAELYYIESATNCMDGVQYHRPPFCSILKSRPVWALLIVMTTDSLGYYTVFNCAPMYMKQVLKYDIKADGVLICIPYLAGFIAVIPIASIVDYITSKALLEVTTIRKIFTFIGEAGPAISFVGIGLAGCNHIAVVALMIAIVSLASFGLGGFSTNHVDIAPTYAGTLMGLTNGISNVMGFMTPVIVDKMTGNSASRSQWQHAFFLMGGLMALGTLFYMIFGTAKEEKWSIEGRERHLKPHSERNTPCPSLESSRDHQVIA